MNERAESNSVVVAIIVGLLLLLLVGGFAVVAIFFFRQQVVVRQQVDRAMVAEQMARMEAEQARMLAESQAVRAAAANQTSPAETNANERADIEAVLNLQVTAWNTGDIDAFMEHYWKSGELTFSSGGKTTRGWNATLTRYRERYPTPEKMGQLKFDGLEITPLGEQAALVLGQWHLERDAEPLNGNFSLVFRKIDGRWLIVHDHTSRIAE